MSGYPYINYAAQVEAAEWHLSSQASIALVVCLPIIILLLAVLACWLWFERKDLKRKVNNNINHNPGQGAGGNPAVPGGNQNGQGAVNV